MLKILRHKGLMKFLLWSVAGVIILSFGILSNAYLLTGQSGKLKYAGKVFGQKVSLEDFQQNLDFTIFQLHLQYGQNFNQVVDELHLVQQAWERIILIKQARKQKIKVSDNEVATEIRKSPFFRNENTGVYDHNIYQTVLSQAFRTTPRIFEENMRNDLMIRKLFERETFAASISDEDILEDYMKFNEKIRVAYVLFPTEMYINEVLFDEIKAKNFFLEHKQDFIKPASINVSYIQIPFSPDNSDSQDAAYKKAYNALTDLEGGTSFMKVAQTYQIEVKESGFFDIQQPDLSLGWPLETFQALFRTRIGSNTNIITTENSYDIAQVMDKRPPFHPPYNDIKEEVKNAFLKSEALKISKQKAEQSLTNFNPQGDFAATAAALNLEIFMTPDFSIGQYLPVVGPGIAFQRSAFALSKEDPLSDAVQTEKGYAILHFEERIPVDMAKFEEEKDAFGQQILSKKKLDLFEEYVASLLAKAELEDLISKHINKQDEEPLPAE